MRNFLHKITFGLVLSTDQIAIITEYEQARGTVRMTYKGVMAVQKVTMTTDCPPCGFGGRP